MNAGKESGEVKGLRDAHSIALDSNGQYGYVSDSPANAVRIFDRRTLEIVATVPTGKNPRAVVFEPASRLVLVVCPDTAPADNRAPRHPGNGQAAPDSGQRSTISIIDADTQKPLVDLLIPGKLGFAAADGNGRVYVAITDRNQIAYFNAQSLESRLRRQAENAAEVGGKAGAEQDGSAPSPATDSVSASSNAPAIAPATPQIDWGNPNPDGALPRALHVFQLQNCQSPKGLAIDSTNERLFTACDNMQMQVLNASNGQMVATLPIGAGTDAIGYDPNHGLIYTSNGGGVGSLTIIRQHLSDSYAVIQELPTQARARTLAVNPGSGEVYLVTNVTGFDLTHKGGVGGLKAAAVKGSFQVLVVGD